MNDYSLADDTDIPDHLQAPVRFRLGPLDGQSRTIRKQVDQFDANMSIMPATVRYYDADGACHNYREAGSGELYVYRGKETHDAE